MSASPSFHSVYGEPHLDRFYNMLFCDNLDLARQELGHASGPWATTLGADSALRDIQAIAMNAAAPSRLRALAFQRLQEARVPVPQVALGVVIEITMPKLQDTLAAYSDGNVMYMHHEKGAYSDNLETPRTVQFARAQVAGAEQILAMLDRWEGVRMPPPKLPLCRVSVVASDGLYFAEGSLDRLFNSPSVGVAMRVGQLIQENVFESWKARAA